MKVKNDFYAFSSQEIIMSHSQLNPLSSVKQHVWKKKKLPNP